MILCVCVCVSVIFGVQVKDVFDDEHIFRELAVIVMVSMS